MISTTPLSENERTRKRSSDLLLHYELLFKKNVSLIIEITTDSQNRAKHAIEIASHQKPCVMKIFLQLHLRH